SRVLAPQRVDECLLAGRVTPVLLPDRDRRRNQSCQQYCAQDRLNHIRSDESSCVRRAPSDHAKCQWTLALGDRAGAWCAVAYLLAEQAGGGHAGTTLAAADGPSTASRRQLTSRRSAAISLADMMSAAPLRAHPRRPAA